MKYENDLTTEEKNHWGLTLTKLGHCNEHQCFTHCR